MKTEELATQSIEYSRTIVPSSMRSPYWKYFGFPSDNANKILTKQKIICTICNTAIAYNKNTSNLRTHLIAKHCELLHELQQQQQQHNGIGSNSSNIQHSRKRSHSDMVALTLPADDTSASTITDNSYMASDYKRHGTSLIVEEQDDLVELVDGSSIDAATVENNPVDALDYGDYTTTLEQPTADEDEAEQQQQHRSSDEIVLTPPPYSFVNGENIGTNRQKLSNTSNSEITNLIADMLIKDVMPLSTINGIGFLRLFSQIGTVDKSAVERKLNSLYDSMLQCITEHLEQFSQTNLYSLSIETNKNVDKFTVICIYVNYYSTEDNELLSVLFQNLVSSTTEDGEVIDLHQSLKNFNLSNCAAVILNKANTFAELFFQTHDIPIIPCMECVLRRCMHLFFDLPTVNAEFTKILKVTENAVKAENDLMITLPEVFPQCPWSKLNLLQFANENLSFSDDAAELLKETRELIEYITPLKVTLDTIAEEPLTLCSLMRPLTLKLLEEHYATDSLGDGDYLTEANRQLHQELINSILINKFLIEATFFDARFRRDFLDDNHVKAIKDDICIRYKPILEQANKHGGGARQIKVEHDTNLKTDNSSGSQRKSSLKSFFKRNTESFPKTSAAAQKFNIDYEINKYKCEPTLDLEQCPIDWWHENSYNYKQLKQIADYYMNVPCCVNRLFRNGINERNELQNKRLMLRNQSTQRIWYLHYNEKFYDKIRQT